MKNVVPSALDLGHHPGNSRITDFDDLCAMFSGWQGKFEQCSVGRFEGSLWIGEGRKLQAHLVRVNQSLRVRGREKPGLGSVSLVISESAGSLWHGRRLDPGCVVVRGGDVEADHRTSRKLTYLGFALPEADLRQAARAVNGDDIGPLCWQVRRPSPDGFSELNRLIRRLLLESAVSSFCGASGEIHQIEQACLRATVELLFPPARGCRVDLPLASRTTLARRAEDLMRSRLETAMGEIDLCEQLGVSGRTLRLACREHFGMGPMVVYQTLRLNAVREMLKSTQREECSIAESARRFGFNHAGKFSGFYRRLFGEVPSSTLARGNRGRPI
jgi:AraC family transcriptional regulator, ethanolamine operon transcriptional activator